MKRERLTDSDKERFARALIANNGRCMLSEEDVGITVSCNECPFYCYGRNIDPGIEAVKNARRYLLDLEVRKILEGEDNENVC